MTSTGMHGDNRGCNFALPDASASIGMFGLGLVRADSGTSPSFDVMAGVAEVQVVVAVEVVVVVGGVVVYSSTCRSRRRN